MQVDRDAPVSQSADKWSIFVEKAFKITAQTFIF